MRRLLVVAAALAGTAACVSLAGSTGGNETPSTEAGADASTAAEDAARADGDGPDVAIDGASDERCPVKEGPAMVRAGSFCIDSTEVTNAQYTKFLGAGAAAQQPGECGWNTSFTPSSWPPPPGTDDYPVVYVDWCDAYAYCTWAGKRLCGRIGGGALPTSAADDATKDQWFAACSKDGTRTYPYGSAYSVTSCNAGIDGGSPDEVKSHAQCEGGHAGVFDMSGNVHEWVDCCFAATGASDVCGFRGGGSEDTDPSLLSCAGGDTGSQRDSQYSTLGFRCCAD